MVLILLLSIPYIIMMAGVRLVLRILSPSRVQTCSSCKKTKENTDFYFNKRDNRYQNPCKDCVKANYEAKKQSNRGKPMKIPESKVCTKCGKCKSGTEFYYNRNHGRQFTECKSCASNRSMENIYERLENDPEFGLLFRYRSRVRGAFKQQGHSKSSQTNEYLSCSPAFFRRWIEFQLYDGMTMDNHGDVWHLDHVIPCDAFDLSDPEQVRRCFAWSNIRPYRKEKNLEKSNKIRPWDIVLQELKMKVFLRTK